MRALVNSWLVIRVRKRLGQAVALDLIDLHEAAIRMGHLITRIGGDLYRPADGKIVLSAVLVLPKRWRFGKKQRASQPVVLPAAAAAGATGRPSIRALVDQHKTLAKDLRALDRIRMAATRIKGKRGLVDGQPRPLDQSFYRELEGRLSSSDRAVLNTVIPIANLPNVHDDLDDIIQDIAGVKGETANDLCRSIQVFEEDARDTLPPAEPPIIDNRPSINALGWGDLYVVREKLLRYEAQEIAHIENVLPGEKKNREHERTHRLEQVVEFESTKEKFSERDLETSERFELQSEASQTVKTDFSIDAGINTSGKYGLTTVETSLDVDASTSKEESNKTVSQTAQSVVSKSIERTQEKVRELRRTTTIETMRELATHVMDNTTTGTGPTPQPISGVYLWVEKILEVQLHQYGKRLMIEVQIPEPGLSLIHSQQPFRPAARKPAPFRIGPNEISSANYLCLTELYQAQQVSPPPPLIMKVGLTFKTEPNDTAGEVKAAFTANKELRIPVGYRPLGGAYAITGRGIREVAEGHLPKDRFHAHLSIGGEEILNSSAEADMHVDGRIAYQNAFQLSVPTVTDDVGLPIAVRLSGHNDNTGTVNIYVECERGTEVFAKWQIETYEKIKQAYDVLVEQYQQASQVARFQAETERAIGSRPSSVNRSIERDELKKWAIKLMRVKPFEFDSVIDNDGVQEISAGGADDDAPIVRFFEQSFEWDNMSYFLYPYFWGRRKAWDLRQNITVADDPLHEKFLKAGSARVIVPISPGYESRVLDYLPFLISEEDRIKPKTILTENSKPNDFKDHPYEELWVELLLDRKDDLTRGQGTLNVTQGNPHVTANADGWVLSDRDIGREVYIDAEPYAVIAVDTPDNAMAFRELEITKVPF